MRHTEVVNEGKTKNCTHNCRTRDKEGMWSANPLCREKGLCDKIQKTLESRPGGGDGKDYLISCRKCGALFWDCN